MDPKPLLDYIARHITLTEAEVELLLSKLTYRRYLKGQYIVQQGDICQFENFV